MKIQYLGQQGVTGRINKAWYLIDGKRYLAKGNSPRTVGSMGEVGYQPYSEVIATEIAKYLGIEHIPYYLGNAVDFKEVEVYGIRHVSLCEDYNKNGYIIRSLKEFKENNLKCTKKELIGKLKDFGVDVRPLYNILIFDAIIGNVDRHLNNIDLYIKGTNLKQSITKEDISYVPIYDNGASFCGDDPRLMIILKNLPLMRIALDLAKPFEMNHTKQLKIIPKEYLQIINKENLYTDIMTIVKSIAYGNIPTIRYKLLQYNIKWRIQNLETIMEGNICK